MFERFTEDARKLVVGAQAEATELRYTSIGTEHLLLAALRDGAPTRTLLSPLGLTYERVQVEIARRTDADGGDAAAALRAIGIDVDLVRQRVEAIFGPGSLEPAPRRRRALRRRHRTARYIPFSAEAKRALESALREALDLRSREIRAEHVVLGALREEGPVTSLLRRLDVAPGDVRRAILSHLGRAA